MPTQNNLRYRFIIIPSYRLNGLFVENIICFCQRTPGLGNNFMCLIPFTLLFLIEKWMQLNLIDAWFHACFRLQPLNKIGRASCRGGVEEAGYGGAAWS